MMMRQQKVVNRNNLIKFTISGKWVISSTLVTETPDSSNEDAVPPVETIEYLQEYSCL